MLDSLCIPVTLTFLGGVDDDCAFLSPFSSWRLLRHSLTGVLAHPDGATSFMVALSWIRFSEELPALEQ
jgi:hypothetical protein